MRIGILTFLHNENYGSLLQAYALQRVLTGLGHEAAHLDYAPCAKEKVRNLLACGNSPRLVLDGVRKRKAARSGGYDRAKAEALRRFREERLRLTAPCRDAEALRAAAADFDLLLCGSDQIWSPEWLNPAYFFDFAPADKPLIAYAPSLGVARMRLRGHKARVMRRCLRRFRAVSVREPAGAAILGGLTGKTPPVLPDPVLLLSEEDWRALASAEPRAPYLLGYFIGENPAYFTELRRLAEEKGLRPLLLPSPGAEASGIPTEADASPEVWLARFAQAGGVVTDSFHGCAFATLFGVPFTPLKRYADGSANSKNSRIDRLLGACGMEWGECDPSRPAVREKLAGLRQEGLDWLTEQLA